MVEANKIVSQLNSLTRDLINTGLCDDQNFPRIITKKGDKQIVSIGELGTNIFLKNIPYEEIYYEMLKRRAYNFKMLDGAMLLLEYTFQKEEIIHHRLSFFPSPDLLEYQQNEQIYMEDDIYLDILDKQVVTVPLRFDFEKQDGIATAIEHPVSHLTIGQYQNCRIPVSSAVPPSLFVDFIIRNFYHTAYNKFCDKISKYRNEFSESITETEKELIYIGVPPY